VAQYHFSVSPVSPYNQFDGSQSPISLGADFNSDLRGMTLGVYEQAFMPVEEQLHGPIGCLSQQCGVDLAGYVFFTSKTAAHQLADHAFPGNPGLGDDFDE
jgi:hypothetical protein